MSTPIERLGHLEAAAYQCGEGMVYLPQGFLTIVARNTSEGFAHAVFDYWYDQELHGANQQRIDRTIAAGLMAEKWTTPLEL